MKDSNTVFGNNALLDEEMENLDLSNLKAPTLWRFDEETDELYMLFKEEGKIPSVWHSSARMGEHNGIFCIATLATSQEVILWDTNRSEKLCKN